VTDGEEKFIKRAARLFALIGSANRSESETARTKLEELLKKNQKTWNDLPKLLGLYEALIEQEQQKKGASAPDPAPYSSPNPDAPPVPNIFDLVFHLLKKFVFLKTEDEYTALTLWVLHTWVFNQFMITPRLAVLSPVRDCGKTLVLDLLKLLTRLSDKLEDPSAAGLYRLMDLKRGTVLVDEGDNLSALNQPGTLRTIFNAGHREDGSITRAGNPVRVYVVFCPLAIAAIGKLPSSVLSRSVVLQMQRAPRNVAATLERFDTKNLEQMQMFSEVRWYIQEWGQHCNLQLDPPMPKELYSRRADNWRVLVAIGDACDHGDEARTAAVALSRQHHDEDLVVELLADIRSVFAADRMLSKDLCTALHGLDDRAWIDWRGLGDNRPPRPITQAELADLLGRFGIKPRKLWPLGARADVVGGDISGRSSRPCG
jgi:hypothetical protein